MNAPQTHLTRRAAIRVGGAGLFGLGLPQLLAAETRKTRTARAKSIIFLHQWGGPGQHETFDPKPDAPDNVRGWYGATKTSIPGVIFGEKLPKLAKMADKLTVIRCMQHAVKMNNHNSAGYYSLTGIAPPTDDQRLRDSLDLFPAYGSIVSKLAPAPKGIAKLLTCGGCLGGRKRALRSTSRRSALVKSLREISPPCRLTRNSSTARTII